MPVHKIWSASITYILANPYVCFVCQYIINNCLVCQYIKKICAGSPEEYFRWYCWPVHQLFLTDASTRLHCSPVHICTGMRIRIFMMLINDDAPNMTTEMRGSHPPQNWAAVAGQHCHRVIRDLSIRVVPGCPRANITLREKAVLTVAPP